MTRYRKVAVGGSFDKFHKGHEALISTAFNVADEVLIGVTSDDFASYKDHQIQPCHMRIAHLRRIADSFNVKYTIKEITDANGTADVDEELDAIVVSQETEQSAVHINEIRLINGLNPLDIIVIEWVLADDDIPISSTRIRKGEIDMDGNLVY